jgi:recyclin-1
VDRFEANLLATFEFAQGKNDETGMKVSASAGWRVWEGSRTLKERERFREWEIGRVWIEKQEVFYEGGQRDPLNNFSSVEFIPFQYVTASAFANRKTNALQFDAMDEFISHLIQIINTSGGEAVKIFPLDSSILLLFAERLSNEVVSQYHLYQARKP